MHTDSTFRVVSCAGSDSTIKQTHKDTKSFLSCQAAVSVWKPNGHALAPQVLTSLGAGRSGIFLHCCVPSHFREINQTEDVLTFWDWTRRSLDTKSCKCIYTGVPWPIERARQDSWSWKHEPCQLQCKWRDNAGCAREREQTAVPCFWWHWNSAVAPETNLTQLPWERGVSLLEQLVEMTGYSNIFFECQQNKGILSLMLVL